MIRSSFYCNIKIQLFFLIVSRIDVTIVLNSESTNLFRQNSFSQCQMQCGASVSLLAVHFKGVCHEIIDFMTGPCLGLHSVGTH